MGSQPPCWPWFVADCLPAEHRQAANAKFTLTSPVMKNCGTLAKKYAGNNPQNKNCDGRGISIPLRWSRAPAGVGYHRRQEHAGDRTPLRPLPAFHRHAASLSIMLIVTDLAPETSQPGMTA